MLEKHENSFCLLLNSLKYNMRLYIAVRDIVPDHMVPVLVAHSILGAHEFFSEDPSYELWYYTSFKKCIVKVNEKEWEKIKSLEIPVFLGHENTVDKGNYTCAIIQPTIDDKLPNVLKFAKLWKPGKDFK